MVSITGRMLCLLECQFGTFSAVTWGIGLDWGGTGKEDAYSHQAPRALPAPTIAVVPSRTLWCNKHLLLPALPGLSQLPWPNSTTPLDALAPESCL